MKKLMTIMLALFCLAAKAQVYVKSQCPLKATHVIARKYLIHQNQQGVEGGTGGYGVTLDLGVKNTGDRPIAAISFEIHPGTRIAATRQVENNGAFIWHVRDNLGPGQEKMLFDPDFLQPWHDEKAITIQASDVRYADGENAHVDCLAGMESVSEAIDVAGLKAPRAPSEVLPLSEVSPPRNMTREWNLPGYTSDKGPVSISFVVEADGSVRDFKPERGDPRFTNALMEVVKTKFKYVPAWKDGHPVATRITVSRQ